VLAKRIDKKEPLKEVTQWHIQQEGSVKPDRPRPSMMVTKAKATTLVVGSSNDGLVTLTASDVVVVATPQKVVLDSA
jgi:hypothetical protein